MDFPDPAELEPADLLAYSIWLAGATKRKLEDPETLLTTADREQLETLVTRLNFTVGLSELEFELQDDAE